MLFSMYEIYQQVHKLGKIKGVFDWDMSPRTCSVEDVSMEQKRNLREDFGILNKGGGSTTEKRGY